jgi:peptidoglycan/LPS O-acetylase OafA/YrhL
MSPSIAISAAVSASTEASLAPSAADRYRPALDGLRAIAVLAVFIFHLNKAWLPGGFVGVDVFFVISGYLITSILVRDYEKGRFTLARFYQRRIARLLPAFFTAGLVTLIAAFFIYLDQDLASCGLAFAAATLSAANLKFMFDGGYFVILPDAHPLLHYWSLSVEEQFYMVFPLAFLLVFLKAKRHKLLILGLGCLLSLVACVLMTHSRPTWAFYLLPTRAWELLAGGILANLANHGAVAYRKIWTALSPLGLGIIVLSLFLIQESLAFPGAIAILPVLGTILVIGREGAANGIVERFLSNKPFVFVGKISYSLYLWHWPVFAFVDYRFYQDSALLRLVLKIGLSFLFAIACFFWIESRGRVYLNRPDKKRMAFAFLAGSVVFSVALGLAVRNEYYVDASARSVAKGGVIFNPAGKAGTVVLMGDSNGAMYGKALKELTAKLDYRFVLISVSAADPLPYSSWRKSQLWLDSLNVVKHEKPTVLILVCEWEKKLHDDKGRVALAVKDLRPYAQKLVLVTQPPSLPITASRDAIRNGSRPPFVEEAAQHSARLETNDLVEQLAGGNVSVLNIEQLFASPDGAIKFTDRDGRQLYEDPVHLSGFGADLLKPSLVKAMTNSKLLPARLFP